MAPRPRTSGEKPAAVRGEAIVSGLIGNALKTERETRGLSRADVAAKTKIPTTFIELIEESHPALVPQSAYSTIYIKAYCAFLGFDAAEMLRVFKSTAADPAQKEELKQRHPKKTLPEWQLIAAPTLLRNTFVGLAALGLLTYFTLQLFKIVSPPAIAIASPEDGTVISAQEVVIEGRTEREAELRINGEPIFLDEAGAFKDVVTLNEGLNVISIVGKKKYSQPQTVTRRIIVEPARQ